MTDQARELLTELRHQMRCYLGEIRISKHKRPNDEASVVKSIESIDMALAALSAPAEMEPKYFDSDGYRAENGVQPKFVLKSDYDAIRAWAIGGLSEAKIRAIVLHCTGQIAHGIDRKKVDDAIENAIRQPLRESAPSSGWQPIESAPKDGRTLLLGRRLSSEHWRTMRGQWFSKETIESEWENDDCDAGWYETSVENDEIPNCWATEPTHWQPLPAPPGQLARGER